MSDSNQQHQQHPRLAARALAEATTVSDERMREAARSVLAVTKKRFVPATELHLVDHVSTNETQAAIDHLESLGYTVVAPSTEAEEKLRAA